MINAITDIGLLPQVAGSPLTYAQCATNTTTLKTWLANTSNWGKKVFFPCMGPGLYYYFTEKITVQFNHFISEQGAAFSPLSDATHTFPIGDVLFELHEAILEDMEIAGNRANNPTRTGALISTNPTSQPLWHPWLKNVKLVDFPHTAVAHNYDSLRMDDCIVIGQGQYSVNGSGVGTSSYFGVWCGSTSCELTIRGGVYDDMAWNAVFGGGKTIIDGARFHNNHRQISPTGGGHIAMGLGTSCQIVNCGIVQSSGLTTGASGLEMDNCPWTVIGNYIEGIQGSGHAAIVNQGAYKHKITNNNGSGNVINYVKTHAGTDLSVQTGNF